MNQTVQRYQIADYLNVGEMKAETYELMGAGFNTLDENPAAQLDTKHTSMTAQQPLPSKVTKRNFHLIPI